MRYQWKYEEKVNNIKKSLKKSQKELYALQHLKRLTKKDGKPFANLSNNYEDAKISFGRSIYGYVTSIDLAGSWAGEWNRITIYYNGESKLDLTLNEIEEMIAQEIGVLTERVASYEAQLKVAEKAFEKIDAAVEELLKVVYSIPETIDGRYNTSLGYALLEYAKETI